MAGDVVQGGQLGTVRKKGNRYYFRYYDAAGARHEVALGTDNEKEANRQAALMETDLESSTRPPGRSLTVAEAWELFEETVLPGKREGTRVAYRSAMQHNWLPKIGEDRLMTLRPDRIRRVLEAMDLSPSTKALRRNQLSGLYKWAIRVGYAQRNPCRDVEMPGKQDPVVDTIAPRYLHLMVRHCPLETRPMVMTLAYAGLRVGELRGLTWNDIGDDGTLHVVKSVYREGRDAIHQHGKPFSKTKSVRGKRDVPIPMALVSELRRWQEVSKDYPNDWDLIFPNHWGGPLRHEALGRHVREAARIVAALPEMDPSKRQAEEERFYPEQITPRTLRHGYARLMLMLGMRLPELQAIMGHAHYETTLRYAHYERKDRPYAVRALDSAESTLRGGGKYLATDMDDLRKHAIGVLQGRDIGNYGGNNGGSPAKETE